PPSAMKTCSGNCVSSSQAMKPANEMFSSGRRGPYRQLSHPVGPASPRRLVCAPAATSTYSVADQPGMGERTMSLHSGLQNFRSALAPRRSQRGHRPRDSARAARQRPNLEVLEDRTLPSTFTVLNLADSGAGSLRQAVLDANSPAFPGLDV